MDKDLLKALEDNDKAHKELHKQMDSILEHLGHLKEEEGDFLTDDEYESIYGKPRV